MSNLLTESQGGGWPETWGWARGGGNGGRGDKKDQISNKWG